MRHAPVLVLAAMAVCALRAQTAPVPPAPPTASNATNIAPPAAMSVWTNAPGKSADDWRRRARPPRERRREGDVPGIVTIPYGKTASGERTHLYRIMGQGGVVADFTDYGARLVRLYTPDATADLANILEGFRPSVIDCEKAGDLAAVWTMTPIRRPRATGLVFELRPNRQAAEPSNRQTVKPSNRVTYWLDASNTLTVESSITDTNAVKWASTLTLAPLKGRKLEIVDALGTRTYANTTNSVTLALRPGTNALQRLSIGLGQSGVGSFGVRRTDDRTDRTHKTHKTSADSASLAGFTGPVGLVSPVSPFSPSSPVPSAHTP